MTRSNFVIVTLEYEQKENRSDSKLNKYLKLNLIAMFQNNFVYILNLNYDVILF